MDKLDDSIQRLVMFMEIFNANMGESIAIVGSFIGPEGISIATGGSGSDSEDMADPEEEKSKEKEKSEDLYDLDSLSDTLEAKLMSLKSSKYIHDCFHLTSIFNC